jgi:hypothetical protein
MEREKHILYTKERKELEDLSNPLSIIKREFIAPGNG